MKLVTNTSTVVPATLYERVKDHLRVSNDTEGGTILTYIDIAIDDAENWTGRTLFTKTLTYYLSDFPSSGEIELPTSPVASVQTVKYYDTDGNLQTFSSASYRVNTKDGSRPTITLNDTADWPDVDDDNDEAVEIAFTAGYGDDINDAPAALVGGLILYAGHIYDNRNAQSAEDLDKVRMGFFNRFKARWYQ